MFLFTVSNNSPIDEQVFVSIRYITNKYKTIISKFQKKRYLGLCGVGSLSMILHYFQFILNPLTYQIIKNNSLQIRQAERH